MVLANTSAGSKAGNQTPTVLRIPIATLGMSLSLFLALSFVLCILGYLVLPGLPVKHEALAIFLPGFELLTWQGFAIGLAESYAWGWYIALVLGAIYNFFAGRQVS
jgi:hypothetical protein